MTEQMRQKINNLLLSLAEGSELALEELSRLVSGRMLSIALSIVHNRAVAEDVVQDSFVRIICNIGAYNPNTNGYAWICKITQNLALNAWRHENRFKSVNIEDCFSLAATDDVFEVSSAHVMLKQALAVLEPSERLILYQKYFMDLSLREIAEVLGKSKSAVQRALTSAEEKVKKFVKSGTN